MLSPTLETRTYVGQSGTRAHDGIAGFVVRRQYQLRYEHRGGQVAIVLEHAHMGEARELVVSEGEFEKWFRK